MSDNHATWDKLYEELKIGLSEINSADDGIIKKARKAIEKCYQSIKVLKSHVHENGFKDEKEEIFFFREIKPAFAAQLFYYQQILNIELRRPSAGIESTQSFLNEELKRIELFFNLHADLFTYYRSGANYLDKQYFVRNQIETFSSYHLLPIDIDFKFSTGYDLLVARLKANERVVEYLQNQIEQLKNKDDVSPVLSDEGNVLQWQGPVNGLGALIIACHAKKAFGNVSLYRAAVKCSKFFNVKLNHIHKIKEELALSKKPAAFIEDSIAALKQALDQETERQL